MVRGAFSNAAKTHVARALFGCLYEKGDELRCSKILIRYRLGAPFIIATHVVARAVPLPAKHMLDMDGQ